MNQATYYKADSVIPTRRSSTLWQTSAIIRALLLRLAVGDRYIQKHAVNKSTRWRRRCEILSQQQQKATFLYSVYLKHDRNDSGYRMPMVFYSAFKLFAGFASAAFIA